MLLDARAATPSGSALATESKPVLIDGDFVLAFVLGPTELERRGHTRAAAADDRNSNRAPFVLAKHASKGAVISSLLGTKDGNSASGAVSHMTMRPITVSALLRKQMTTQELRADNRPALTSCPLNER